MLSKDAAPSAFKRRSGRGDSWQEEANPARPCCPCCSPPPQGQPCLLRELHQPSKANVWGFRWFTAEFRSAAASDSRGSSGRGRRADEAWREQPRGRREAGRGLAEVTAGSSVAPGRKLLNSTKRTRGKGAREREMWLKGNHHGNEMPEEL